MDVPGTPAETNLESVAWYLLSMNPFFDYAFTLPGKQSVLMLDWAKTESVLFDDITRGVTRPYDPFDPSSAAGTPRASSCLTPLQSQLATEFVGGPSKAKVVGVHAPPIGPYSDWYLPDLLAGRKTYKNPRTARGPNEGHPLFAIRPDGAPYGMTPERGTFEKLRSKFITMVANPKYSVRMVLSGHIHRNGLYVVHPAANKIYVATPKDIVKQRPLVGALLVRGVVQQSVRGARPPAVTGVPDHRPGPLYVTTTSAGPRGSFEDLPLSGSQTRTGVTTDPGYASLELASDGTIKGVEFRAPRKIAAPPTARPAVQPEVAYGTW
jgi:hypothetical protein